MLRSELSGSVTTVPLWEVAAGLLIALILATVYGSIARWILRGRVRLSMTAAVVVALTGTSLGLLITWFIRPDASMRSGLSVALCLAMSVLGVGVYGLIAARFQKNERRSTAELIRTGESDRVEFKSTARYNLRSGAKDPAMEIVVAKTIAVFQTPREALS